VTPHLLIPVCAEAECPPPATAAAPSGVFWQTGSFEAAFVYRGVGIAATDPPRGRPQKVVLKVSDELRPELDPIKATKAVVTLRFPAPFDKVTVPLGPTTFDVKSRTLTLNGDDLAAKLCEAFGTVFRPDSSNPVRDLTATATVEWRRADDATVTVPGGERTTNTLTVRWVKAPSCCK
jgi:hypothetical protein